MAKDEANGVLLESYRTESGGPRSEKTPLLIRLAQMADRFKLKSVLGHLGLLVALCLYCFFGGMVSTTLKIEFWLILALLPLGAPSWFSASC